MRRLAVLFSVLALTACSRKHGDDQGFHPDEAAPSGTGDPHAMEPPPAVGPGALGGRQGGGGGDLPQASGDMPDDDVHAGIAARNAAAGGSPHQGGGGPDVGAMGLQSPDPNAPVDPSKYLRGSIHPSDAVKAKIPPNALVYISVKKADPSTGEAVPGMPIATLQLHAASWPLPFEVTERNIMTAGSDFSGDVVITARYAQNPDPLMKAPGDVTGHVRVTIPADKLDVTLDTVLP